MGTIPALVEDHFIHHQPRCEDGWFVLALTPRRSVSPLRYASPLSVSPSHRSRSRPRARPRSRFRFRFHPCSWSRSWTVTPSPSVALGRSRHRPLSLLDGRAITLLAPRVLTPLVLALFPPCSVHRPIGRSVARFVAFSALLSTGRLDFPPLLLARLYRDVVKQPGQDERIAPEIKDPNSGNWPYFKGCVGALDGTYIPILPFKVKEPGQWRSRKGGVAQNVMAACDFDMNFTFVQPGYPGSGSDGGVLRQAIANGFTAPEGRYYLADGGYTKKNRMLLVPYQKTRYQQQPQTRDELFNLRHAQLRNVVERLFGIVKKRWGILAQGPNQSFTIRQKARFVIALAAVHNFANQHGQRAADEDVLDDDGEDASADGVNENEQGSVGGRVDWGPRTDNGMVRYRDQIAQQMWEDCLRLRAFRASHP